jgi:hypothetical protein
MVDIQDLQSKLNKMLNGKENPNNVRISDYIDDVSFGVITYASYLDNISDIQTNKNVIPVYISEPSGTVEPIPKLGEINMQYQITLYFPMTLKDKFFKLMSYFIDVFAGRFLDFGNSGKALCNLTVPTFGEIDQQEFKQFADFMQNKYKLPIMTSSMWGSYTFTLYFHQLNNLGKENGFILGNQVSYNLSFTYNNTKYSEDVILTSSARNYTADPVSQQIMGEFETLSLNKNSSYADSIQVYAKNNDFWNTFRDLFENGLLQDVDFTLEKTYEYDNKTYTKNLILVSCPQEIEFGEAITYTFAFAKKASIR